ncbi:MAG TPA: hypothetical protein VFC99_05775 [Acidimicrobiia bacterium]|nr:hypothetical protein [Acidimicrobiia bacterium]
MDNGPRAISAFAAAAEDHTLFSAHWRDVLMRTGIDAWVVKDRRLRKLALRHDPSGVTVQCLPADTFRGVANPAYAFATYLAWLRDRDVIIGRRASWYTLGRQLIDNTCAVGPAWTRWFTISSVLAQERAGYYGGRKQAHPGMFRDCVHYDLAAAYPHALGTTEWPFTLSPVRASERERHRLALHPDTLGLARASVVIPDELCWSPLPFPLGPDRHYLAWNRRSGAGWWSTFELRLAYQHGAAIFVDELYAAPLHHYDNGIPAGRTDVFGPWLAEVKRARKLPHGADRLAKLHANRAWGMLAAAPIDTYWRRYSSLRPRRQRVVRRLPGRTYNPGGYWVAALVAAQVRARVYREMLDPLGDAAVHVDTDGVVGPRRHPGPYPKGVSVGRWHMTPMPLVRVYRAQRYRFTCTGCGLDHPAWHTVAAGVPIPDDRDVRRRGEPIDPEPDPEGEL